MGHISKGKFGLYIIFITINIVLLLHYFCKHNVLIAEYLLSDS